MGNPGTLFGQKFGTLEGGYFVREGFRFSLHEPYSPPIERGTCTVFGPENRTPGGALYLKRVHFFEGFRRLLHYSSFSSPHKGLIFYLISDIYSIMSAKLFWGVIPFPFCLLSASPQVCSWVSVWMQHKIFSSDYFEWLIQWHKKSKQLHLGIAFFVTIFVPFFPKRPFFCENTHFPHSRFGPQKNLRVSLINGVMPHIISFTYIWINFVNFSVFGFCAS